MASTTEHARPERVGDLPAPKRRAIRAWCFYDWANSAFATSGAAAIFPVYFVFLFKDAFGESAELFGVTFTGSSVWSVGVAMSTAIVALISPILGVIADRIPIKKALLWAYTAVGALFTFLTFFAAYASQPWLWAFALFAIANIGFSGGLVFYNSFLVHLGPRHLLDDISSRGFALGYLGGGLLLAVHLVAILLTTDTQYAELVTRAAIASVGVWWFGWALWTLIALPEPPIHRPLVGGVSVWMAVRMGASGLRNTFRELKRFKTVMTYLASYLLFNDGLQTVLALAGAFAADTLGVPLAFNMGTVLIVQLVAAPGAMAFGWFARRSSTKTALYVALTSWVAIVLFGIAVAPLEPTKHADFDVRLSYSAAMGVYRVDAAPNGETVFESDGRKWPLAESVEYPPSLARDMLDAAREAEDFAYGVSVSGGALNGERALGGAHPAALGDGALDALPIAARSAVWQPLGLPVGFQWLLLGVFVGLVIGGSQALARSLFAQITPETRSGEFFSFFGFMSRASTVLGPTLYVIATAVFDTRVSVAAILAIIVAGVIVLRWVNVQDGARVAAEEDASRLSA